MFHLKTCLLTKATFALRNILGIDLFTHYEAKVWNKPFHSIVTHYAFCTRFCNFIRHACETVGIMMTARHDMRSTFDIMDPHNLFGSAYSMSVNLRKLCGHTRQAPRERSPHQSLFGSRPFQYAMDQIHTQLDQARALYSNLRFK